MLSVFLSPHLRIFVWILTWVSPHWFPRARMAASLFIGGPLIDWVSQILRPEVDFESSRSPAKSESWNLTQATMLSCVAHMTILSVVTCVMNA